MTNLNDNPSGNYRFLPGIAPYSSGVVAMPGYEIVHATLQEPPPYRRGFDLIEAYLAGLGRPRAALCAVELRIPLPLPFDGFAEFNQGYQAILEGWGLLVQGLNPIARTNVAPQVRPPLEPMLYAFSYTVPTADTKGPLTFVSAGAGELKEGTLGSRYVTRAGETTVEAMREKAAKVMTTMSDRLAGMGATWSQVTAVDIYTVHPIHPFLATEILGKMGAAAIHGVHWFQSRPPIIDLEYEMDLRGVRQEIRLV